LREKKRGGIPSCLYTEEKKCVLYGARIRKEKMGFAKFPDYLGESSWGGERESLRPFTRSTWRGKNPLSLGTGAARRKKICLSLAGKEKDKSEKKEENEHAPRTVGRGGRCLGALGMEKNNSD